MNIENEIIFKWTNLCRLCLSPDSDIDLFSSEILSQDCLSKIRSCLNLLVYPGDPMPARLCSKCHLKLDEWCQFRKECIQSEANVKKRLKPYQGIKFVKEYFERCAKFESPEIVSSSSKTNPNSLQKNDEVNSSISNQEYSDEVGSEENYKNSSSCFSKEAKNLEGNNTSIFNSSNTFFTGNFNLSKTTSEEIASAINIKEERFSENNLNKRNNSEWANIESSLTGVADKTKKTISKEIADSLGINQDQFSDNSGEKKISSEWVGIEGGLMGTITSITGDASAFWNPEHRNKHVEEANNACKNIENFNKEKKIKTNSCSLSIQDRTCPNCETAFETEEEFEIHTCCMIGSSTNLENDEHFDESISFGSEYDENDSFSMDELQHKDEINPPSGKLKITPWKCVACNLYFRSILDLRKHYSSVTCLGKKNRTLDCEICYRQFLSFNDLLEHQVNHIDVKLDLTEDDLMCCSQCLLQFPNESRLKNHLLVHTLKRKMPIKYTCSSCSQVFFQKDTYISHLLSHVQIKNEVDSTPDPMESATVTDTSDKSDGPSQPLPASATVEEEPKNPQRPIRCFRCGQMFGSVKQLEHHAAIKHKNPTPYICRKCCLRFSARSQLLMHLRVHMSKSSSKSSPDEETAKNSNSCSVCNAKFLLESDLESHMKTHKVPAETPEPRSPSAPQTVPDEDENSDLFARFKCSLCSRLYARANSCIRHGQQSHKGQKVVPLKLKRSVFLGRRTSLPASGKVKHKCSKCPKYFFSFHAFSVHSYRNHGLKMPNPTDDPTNSLETEDPPESPKPDETESKCPFCSKDIKPSYISLHIKKFHRGEVLDPSMIDKDIPNDSCTCRYCLKTCSTPHNRKLHESIHYPVKAQKNQCETCGQKHLDKSQYEKHVRTCKSIRCGKCHRIFFKFVNLVQHSCSVAKSSEVHKCTVCLSAFTSLDLLQIHIKNFHGKKPELSVPRPGTSKNSEAKRLERELWREESNKIVCLVGEKFYCTFCDCEFSTIQESNEHRAVHPRGNWYAVQISDSLFQCTICDKFFETRKSSLLHINYHKKNLMPETRKTGYTHPSLSLEPEVEIFTEGKSSAVAASAAAAAAPSASAASATSETPKVKKFNCRYCVSAFRDEESLQEHLFHAHVNQT